MPGLSRLTEKDGINQTVQRFFFTAIPWRQVFWTFYRKHQVDRKDTWLLADDECGGAKAVSNHTAWISYSPA